VTVHLIALPLLRLWSAFAGPPARGQPLDAGEKAIIAERPASIDTDAWRYLGPAGHDFHVMRPGRDEGE
jgi:hypothetical protein